MRFRLWTGASLREVKFVGRKSMNGIRHEIEISLSENMTDQFNISLEAVQLFLSFIEPGEKFVESICCCFSKLKRRGVLSLASIRAESKFFYILPFVFKSCILSFLRIISQFWSHCHSEEAAQRRDEEDLKEEDTEEDEEFTETYDYIEEIACLERKTSSRSTPQAIEPSDDEGEMEEEEAEMKELDGTISVKSADDEERSRVKKFVVSYETRVLKSPSPALSHGNYRFYVWIYWFLIFLVLCARTIIFDS